MAGVGPALVADDHIMLLGQQVDELAFGLVAPLQTDNASARQSENLKRKSESKRRNLAKRNNLRPAFAAGQGRDWFVCSVAARLSQGVETRDSTAPCRTRARNVKWVVKALLGYRRSAVYRYLANQQQPPRSVQPPAEF